MFRLLYPSQETWGLLDNTSAATAVYSPKGSFGLSSSTQYILEQYWYAEVLHVDRHYYHYHRSLHNASRSQDNPFA